MSTVVNKKELVEVDIRTKFITPVIVKVGWNHMSYMREV
jgi:type I site-specific restriction endonuclease